MELKSAHRGNMNRFQLITSFGIEGNLFRRNIVKALTAVWMINKQGKIVWAKIESDHKQRPTNEEIRAALDSLK
jgi:hypothetical protein